MNFGENFLNLKYSENNHYFILKNEDFRKDFLQKMNQEIFKNPNMIVKCNESTFSAKDEASIRFTQSEFYENMLDSLGFSRNEDIIRNMKGFKKMDINYDMFCGENKGLERRVRNFPLDFVDGKTPVCYIFHPSFRDEKYQYNLYVKFFVQGNKINVMSLHWKDNKFKDRPLMVLNYRENKLESIEDVEHFLENKVNNYDRER